MEAEMPGVNKDGLEVLLEGNELTIVGHRAAADATGFEFLHRESSQADFRREFVLDPVIDTARIQARIEQGFLVLNLPKTEAVKPRRIEVARILDFKNMLRTGQVLSFRSLIKDSTERGAGKSG